MHRIESSDPELAYLQLKLQRLRYESLLLTRDHLSDVLSRLKSPGVSVRGGHVFNENQPRVPAGTPEGGQWAAGGWRDAARIARERESVNARDAVEPVFVGPLRLLGSQRTLELGFAFFGLWSQQNGPDNQTVLKFRAQEFPVGDSNSLRLEGVQNLTQEDVVKACPRLKDIQQRVDEATERLERENPSIAANILGTKIHKDVEQQIKSLGDPDYAAERSRLKGRDANYGVLGSIRIDALERVGRTVCVYDIKTGERGLSFLRMIEIGMEAISAFKFFPDRIIVAEVRPRLRR